MGLFEGFQILEVVLNLDHVTVGDILELLSLFNLELFSLFNLKLLEASHFDLILSEVELTSILDFSERRRVEFLAARARKA